MCMSFTLDQLVGAYRFRLMIVVVGAVSFVIGCKPRRDLSGLAEAPQIRDLADLSSFELNDVREGMYLKSFDSAVRYASETERTQFMLPEDMFKTYFLKREDSPTALPKKVEKLHKIEKLAVLMYTANFYKYMNQVLRGTGSKNREQVAFWQPLILATASGINKLKTGKDCRVKRGTSLSEDDLNRIKVHSIFKDPGFMSTTLGEVPAQFNRGVTFDIKAKNCRDISSLSLFPAEREVLFPPGATFKVVRKSGSLSGKNVVIELTEERSDSEAQALTSVDSAPGTKGVGNKVVVRPGVYKRHKTPFPVDKSNGKGGDLSLEKNNDAVLSLHDGRVVQGSWTTDPDSRLMRVEYMINKSKRVRWFFILDQERFAEITTKSLRGSGFDPEDPDSEGMDFVTGDLEVVAYYSPVQN